MSAGVALDDGLPTRSGVGACAGGAASQALRSGALVRTMVRNKRFMG
jgi:hypothetical protein